MENLEIGMMNPNAPYYSQWYEYIPSIGMEKFGLYYIPIGVEVPIFITNQHIKGIEDNRYSISNMMRIYDHDNQTFVVPRKNMYIETDIYFPEKKRKLAYHLHRIYMLVFCYFDGCQECDVNHIDGNKLNCHPSNLEWSSHEANMQHAFKYLLPSKVTDEQIIDMINMYNNYEAMKTIANKYGLSTAYLSDILHGKNGRTESLRMQEIKAKHPITRKRIVSSKTHKEVLKAVMNDYVNNRLSYKEISDKYLLDEKSLINMIDRILGGEIVL